MSTTKRICFLVPTLTSQKEICRVLEGHRRYKLSDEAKKAILSSGLARDVIWWHKGGTAFQNMAFAIGFAQVLPLLKETYGVRFTAAPTFANRQVDEDDVQHPELKQDFMEVTLDVPAELYDTLAKHWR